MTAVFKKIALAALLILSIAASVWVSDASENVDVVTPIALQNRIVKSSLNADQKNNKAMKLESIQRSSIAASEINPFNSKSWYVAPPPPPAPPPMLPSAPPLPFLYAGKLEEEGKWVVYLTKGDEFFALSKGDTFDQNYRFDGVENGNLVIQYLPLSIKQLLAVGTNS